MIIRILCSPVLVIVLFGAFASGCDNSKVSHFDELGAAQAVQDGIRLAEAGHLDSAVLRFQDAVELNPNSAEAYYRAGVAYEYTGNLAAAISAYERSIRIDSTRAEVRQNLGQLLGRSGRYDEALAEFSAALRASKDSKINSLSYYCIGLIYGLRGETETAIAAYQESIRSDPTVIHAYLGQARELLRVERAEEAVSVLYAALECDIGYHETYSLLAQAYRIQGNYDEAMEMDQRAQAIQQLRAQKRAHEEAHR
jgi:tetratricopeptide (TPR) repeat protein